MAQNIFQDPLKMDWHMSCLQIFYSIKQIKRGRTDKKSNDCMRASSFDVSSCLLCLFTKHQPYLISEV